MFLVFFDEGTRSISQHRGLIKNNGDMEYIYVKINLKVSDY